MEILGNIYFSEQTFYQKQSLGAPANQYPMMQEPVDFRLTSGWRPSLKNAIAYY